MNRWMFLSSDRRPAGALARWKRTLASLGILGSLLSCEGCERGDPRVATFPVTGVVVAEDGTPVPHALIVLHPLQPQRVAPKPRGTTDAQGRFSLTTYDLGDGAPAGPFAVTLEQWIRDDPTRPPSNHLPPDLAKANESKIRISVAEGVNEWAPLRVR